MAGSAILQEKKRKYSLQDDSHTIQDTYLDVVRNVIIIAIISTLVWLACSSLLFIIEHTFTEFKQYFDRQSMANRQVVFAWLGLSILIAGLLRTYLYKKQFWRREATDGIDVTLNYFHDTYQHVNLDQSLATTKRYACTTFGAMWRRLIYTYLTIGTGGSGGVEGPAIPMGEAVGAGIAKLFKIRVAGDLRVFQMSGIAAAITTLLNTPFTGAIFAAEVVFGDRFLYRPILYSLLGCVIVFVLNTHFTVSKPLFFAFDHPFTYTLVEYFEVLVVALLCTGPTGFGVATIFKFIRCTMAYFSDYFKVAFATIMMVLMLAGMWYGLDVPPYHLVGMGDFTLNEIIEGRISGVMQIWWVLLACVLVKILLTGFTVAMVGSAGILMPAMYIGGVCGAALYYLIASFELKLSEVNVDLFVVTGIACGLVAVLEVPLAAIILVIEVFGANYSPPTILAVVVCHLIMKLRYGYQPSKTILPEQKIDAPAKLS